MFMASLDAKWKIPSFTMEGHDILMHRLTTPSLTAGDPHTGQISGIEKTPSDPFLRLSTGATTSGMTSPARWTITVSPTRRSLRRISSSLCRVALLTLAPPTTTGSSTATGVRTPVRPTWIIISRSWVVAWVGGNLYATTQRGARALTPRRSCRFTRSSLITTPSIS